MYKIKEENLGFLGDIGRIIKTMKWTRFCKHPSSYNIQMVKKFYANLVDTTNRRMEVVVRGKKVVYSKAIINMVLGLSNAGDTYQHLLETSDESYYDVFKDSLCNPGTR